MKKILLVLLSAVFAACMACTALFVSAESEPKYEAEKVFTEVTAPITYNRDGTFLVGDGNVSNGTQMWTSAGAYTFSSEPFSVQFRLNGLPAAEGEKKENYFFLNEAGSSKTIWLNPYVLYEGGQNILRLNININDQKPMVDNFTLEGFDFSAADSQSITLTYNSKEKTASIAFGDREESFDLTKGADGGEYAHLDELPTGELAPALMNTRGGILIEKINGSGFIAPDIEEPFDIRPNISKDFMNHAENQAAVAYENNGICISDGEVPGETMKLARMNEKYRFDDVLEIVYRYNGLQPAVGATNKNTYFTITQADRGEIQLKVKLFAYCTSDDTETAQYVLHADVFTGEEGSGQYFAKSQNLLWDCKDFENYTIRLRYEAENCKLKLYNPNGEKVVIDLSQTADGAAADKSQLPVGSLRFETLVQWGGIWLQRVNDQNFKLNYSDFEVSYTDKTDFFAEESDARVAYRNGGIFITNNDKSGITFLAANANTDYQYYNGSMIFEYRFDGLQTYDPSVPLSIQKSVHFIVSDAEGRQVSIQPFLYKNGNVYMLHLNMSADGAMLYENHYLQYDLTASLALNSDFYIKYNAEDFVLEIGLKDAFRTLDLTKRFNGTSEVGKTDVSTLPQGVLRLERVEVQYGGIYLRRINQYSFVVENPVKPDPVDPEIIAFGLPETTYESSVVFEPEISFGDFPDAALQVSAARQGEEPFMLLERGAEGYTKTFLDYGVYEFKFELSFDGITVSTIKTVEYKPSLIGGLDELYRVTSGTYGVIDEGLKFENRGADSADLLYGIGTYEVAGTSTVTFKMNNLAVFQAGGEVHKQVWIDFTDGKNGVWVNVFAFSSPGTAGKTPAYVSVFTFKNGDKGTQSVVRDNVPLGFDFDENGVLNPNVAVTVKYEPSKKLVSVGKDGDSLQAFDLTARDIPEEYYGVNTACNYGGFTVTGLNGFSFANKEGQFTYPAPIVDVDAIPSVIVENNELIIPKCAVYDIFDRLPNVEFALKDPSGEEVELTEKVADGKAVLAAMLSVRGDYELSIKASNDADKSIEKTLTVTVIKEDAESPVMTFAKDAFSAFRQGDRENKFEVKKDTLIVLPNPTLSDDSGLPVELQVTVLTPKGETVILSELRFTGDTIGTYKVEYIATDIAGKQTREIYNFVVKLLWDDDRQEQPTEKTGCGGIMDAPVLALSAVVLGAALAAVLLIGKKKNNQR